MDFLETSIPDLDPVQCDVPLRFSEIVSTVSPIDNLNFDDYGLNFDWYHKKRNRLDISINISEKSLL